MIAYEEDWIFPLLLQVEGSAWLRAASYALPSALLTLGLLVIDRNLLPGLHEDIGMQHLDKSSIWNATTVVLVFLVGFRTKQGLARFWEGTGLLHQMKGEWFDTVSNIVTFTIGAKGKKPKEVAAFRGTIVRLMSLTHASALEEISGTEAQLPTIDVYGIDKGTLQHLKMCVEDYNFNKVEALLHVMQSTITHAQEAGVLGVPPPILSRVYQTLSRGYVNLLNTKKITDTKFPFPYVHMISLLLFLESAVLPFIMCSTLNHLFWAPLCCFLPLFGLYAMNFIAIELENPFGIDPNDLPIMVFQQEMNSCLLMLLHPNADIIASMSKTAERDYEALVRTTKDSQDIDRRLSRFNTSKLDQHSGAAISRSNSRSSNHSGPESPHTPHAPMFFSFDLESSLEEDHVVIRPAAVGAGAVENRIFVGKEKLPGTALESFPNRASVPTDESLRLATGASLMRQPAKHSDAPPGEPPASGGAVAAAPPASQVRQKDMDLLFADMDDFKKVLQLLTVAMQDQVKELSRGLGAMNKLSESSRRREMQGFAEETQVDECNAEGIPELTQSFASEGAPEVQRPSTSSRGSGKERSSRKCRLSVESPKARLPSCLAGMPG